MYYKQAISFNSDYQQAIINLGLIYQKHFYDFYKAEKYFLKAIQSSDNVVQKRDYYAEAYFNFGYIYEQNRQFQKAELFYQNAIKYKPDYAQAHLYIAILYHEQSDKQSLIKAENHYQQAIKLQKNYSAAYNNLGILYEEELKLYNQAQKQYLNAITCNKNNNYAKYNLSQLYKTIFKDYQKTQQILIELLEINNLEFRSKYQQLHEILKNQESQEKVELKKYTIDQTQYSELYKLCKQDDNNNVILGNGTYGTVYQIQNKKTKQFYAMKVIDIDQNKEEIKKEVDNILQLQKKFKSKYIVNIKFALETNPDPGTPQLYIGMELAQCSLKRFQKTYKKQLSKDQANNLIQQILQGLQQMYFQGMIHRDIKPDNILYFEKNQNFKLTDFGTSMLMYDNQNQQTITQITLTGTKEFLGPELYKIYQQNGQQGGFLLSEQQTKEIDWYSNDIFGAGLSFFQAICNIENIREYRNQPNLIKQKIIEQKQLKQYDLIIYDIIERMTEQDQKKRENILCELVVLSKKLK